MRRVTIEQFRAALAGRPDAGAVVSAYRELARRPARAARMVHGDWPVWNQMSAPDASA